MFRGHNENHETFIHDYLFVTDRQTDKVCYIMEVREFFTNKTAI